jgi:DNA-binding PadR family transcriptional regulator
MMTEIPRRLRILRFLATVPEAYGLDIVSGASVSRGVVYIYLADMQDEGLVASTIDDGGAHGVVRRRYRITPAGRALLP